MSLRFVQKSVTLNDFGQYATLVIKKYLLGRNVRFMLVLLTYIYLDAMTS